MNWNSSTLISFNSPRSKGDQSSFFSKSPIVTPTRAGGTGPVNLHVAQEGSPNSQKSSSAAKYRPLLHSPSRGTLPIPMQSEVQSHLIQKRADPKYSFVENSAPVLQGLNALRGGPPSGNPLSQAREPLHSTSSAGFNLDPYNLPAANRGKISNSSAQEFGTSQKPVQLPLMSQRLLSNQLKQSPILPRQASPPRSNSAIGGAQAGTIASGSTPSLYRPISSVHQSRKDLGIQLPSAAGAAGRIMTPLQTQHRADSQLPKHRPAEIDIDVEDELISLRQENLELKDRVSKLEADQAQILDLNHLLLQKLYLLTGLVYGSGADPRPRVTSGNTPVLGTTGTTRTAPITTGVSTTGTTTTGVSTGSSTGGSGRFPVLRQFPPTADSGPLPSN